MTKVSRGDKPRKVTLMEAVRLSEESDPDAPPHGFMPLHGALGVSEAWEAKRRAAWKQLNDDAKRGACIREALERAPKDSDPEWVTRAHAALRAVELALPLAHAHLDHGFGTAEHMASVKALVEHFVPKKAGRKHSKARADAESVLGLFHWANWFHHKKPIDARPSPIADIFELVGRPLPPRAKALLPALLRAYENTKPRRVGGARKKDMEMRDFVNAVTGGNLSAGAVGKLHEKLPSWEELGAELLVIAARIAGQKLNS